MINRLVFSVFFLFCVFGCTYSRYGLSEKEKLSNAVLKNAAQQIQQELGLICCGTTGRAYHQIKMLGLSFNCRRPLDIENGRRLVVEATQKLINAMNAEENLRQYLDHYPVGAEMIWMQIDVQDRSGNSLSMVTANQGVIDYDVKDPGDQHLRLVFQETYKEAVEKLRAQKMEFTGG